MYNISPTTVKAWCYKVNGKFPYAVVRTVGYTSRKKLLVM